MIKRIPNPDFWQAWEDIAWEKIDWQSVLQSIPDLITMIILVTVDSMLYLAGTKRHLEVQMDFDTEMRTAGFANVGNMCFFGAPGYTQLKFTLINKANPNPNS